MGVQQKVEVTRKVYGFIIKSLLHDTIHKSTDLWLEKQDALDAAHDFQKVHFKLMSGNYFLTKEYTVHITPKK